MIRKGRAVWQALSAAPLCSSYPTQAKRINPPWIVYYEKLRTSRVSRGSFFVSFCRPLPSTISTTAAPLSTQVFLRDATSVPPLALLLYGGGIKVQRSGASYILFMEEGWIRFRTPDRTLAELIVEVCCHRWAVGSGCGAEPFFHWLNGILHVGSSATRWKTSCCRKLKSQKRRLCPASGFARRH